jgi:SAM-dependent methyltransferase
MSVISRRATCRLCNSQNLELVFQLAPSPIGDAYVMRDQLNVKQDTYPIDLFLCRECGLSQLIDIIDPEVLYGDYIYLTGSSLGLREHFKEYANDVIRAMVPSKESLIIDIGSNDGILLSYFKKDGHKVLGIEPACHIAERAISSGIETLPEFFHPNLAEKIVDDYGHAAIVTANNVYANIDDLQTFTQGIRTLMAPDGVFIFESFYLADVIQNMVFDFIYHEHLSAFAVKPLQFFFSRMGMELIAVKRVPTKGGSIRYFVQLKNGPRKIDSSVASMINFENTIGLYDHETFQLFSNKVNALKMQTHNVLSKVRAQDRKIVGFGASITATTLIYHFGIGEFLEYLVDDNPDKQGRFSPGLHIPVYAPEELYHNRPDYALILAWRFAEPIIDKNKEFINRGGQFIIPVPEMRIV